MTVSRIAIVYKTSSSDFYPVISGRMYKISTNVGPSLIQSAILYVVATENTLRIY